MTWVLIALNIWVFTKEMDLGEVALEEFFYTWGLVPARFLAGLAEGLPLTDLLVPWCSSMFLHGGWMHLIGNLWFLWIFGDNVEDRLGRWRFLLFYLLGGLAAALAQVVVSPDSTVPMVGASGAISAVLAGYMVLYPKARIVTLIPLLIFVHFAELPAWVFLGLWFVFQGLSGMGSLAAGTEGGVAWFAHVGGFAAGIPLVLLLRRKDRQRRPNRDKPGSVSIITRRNPDRPIDLD
jgi:membrane associated rhomboid family serine protease